MEVGCIAIMGLWFAKFRGYPSVVACYRWNEIMQAADGHSPSMMTSALEVQWAGMMAPHLKWHGRTCG